MNRRVLVTGGAGFIGSHLVEKLLSNGDEVCVIDNFNNDYNPRIKKDNLKSIRKNPSCTIYEGSTLDVQFMDDVVGQFSPEYVVHFAAKSGVSYSLKNPVEFMHTNITGTINLFEALKKADIVVQNVVFASSAWVYGDNTALHFSENDQVEKQNSPYAISKRSGELICRMYSEIDTIPCSCLRFFSVYGPRQRPELAMSVFLNKALKSEDITLYGSTTVTRDYIYIDDAIEGILSALDKSMPFEIYNIGSGNSTSLKSLVSNISKVFDSKLTITKVDTRNQDIPHMKADIRKASKQLSWAPRIELIDGLQRMKEWMSNAHT